VQLEQSFISHAEAPHQLLSASGHAVSLSSSEIVCWEIASPEPTATTEGA